MDKKKWFYPLEILSDVLSVIKVYLERIIQYLNTGNYSQLHVVNLQLLLKIYIFIV